jgi:hypothetical protein
MSGGKEDHVASAAAHMKDGRVEHYWDGSGETMKRFKSILKTPFEAWDVYLVYEKGTRWTGEAPPAPAYWMHQLRSGTREGQPFEGAPYFDGETFANAVRARL